MQCSLDHEKDQHVIPLFNIRRIRGAGRDFVVSWSCMAFIGCYSGDMCWDALKGPSEVVGWRDTGLKLLPLFHFSLLSKALLLKLLE